MAALRDRKMGSVLNLISDEYSTKEFYDNIMDFYGVTNYEVYNISEITDSNDKFYYIYSTENYIESLFIKHGGLPFRDSFISTLKKYKNFNVIFLNEHESDSENCLFLLRGEILKHNLLESQFYFLCNNNKLDVLKDNINSNINVYRINRAPLVSIREMSKYPHPFVLNREYLFMTHNRAVKSHRIALLCMLRNSNLLNSVDWSLIRGFEFKKHFFDSNGVISDAFFKNIFLNEDYNNYKNDIDFFKSIEVKKSEFELSNEFDFPPYRLERSVTYEMNCYSHSYINITTETHYESQHLIQLSEKTFIPFYFFQIPIFVASMGHVEKVKEIYGYDTFDDLIDHSYDNEIDNRKRLIMIIDEIKRLNNKKDFIIDFFKNNQDRFLKNRDMVLNQLTDKSDYNYFQNLI